VQEYEGQLPWIRRNLIEDVCVVAMQGLPIRRWLFWIEDAGIRNDLAAHSEAALPLDREGFKLALSLLSAC
jgi:hypothetical protein